jgi:undecaprenyl-diphosphatase
MTDVFRAAILGIVQGLTEFLPISSSGHLILVPHVLHWPDFGQTFDVATHLGTLAALLIYFRADWVSLARSLAPGGRAQGSGLRAQSSEPEAEERGPRAGTATATAPPRVQSAGERRATSATAASAERRLLWAIVLGCVPAVIAGVFLEKWAETTFRNPLIVAVPMILMALAMAAADRLVRHSRTIDGLGLIDALWIGCAQALALIPGVSRSGSTITAAMALGFRREDAARFSFLMSAPITAGAALYKLRHIVSDGLPPHERLVFLTGILASGIVGYLAIAFLLSYLRRGSLMVFVGYRLVLGAAMLAMFWPRGV